MNILLVVDQNHTYKQAVRAAYDKAMSNGGVDELTERVCQVIFSHPEPENIYHEKYLEGVEYTADGCVSFNQRTGYIGYEQAKIDARKGYANFLKESMLSVGDDLKKGVLGPGSGFGDASLSFVVDERGLLKVVSPVGQLSPEEEALFSRQLNEHRDLKTLAVEYARVVLSLLDCTMTGLNAEYAQCFSPSDK